MVLVPLRHLSWHMRLNGKQKYEANLQRGFSYFYSLFLCIQFLPLWALISVHLSHSLSLHLGVYFSVLAESSTVGLEGSQFSTVLEWERNRRRIATLHRVPCIHHPSFLLSNEIYVNISREREGNQQLLRGGPIF